MLALESHLIDRRFRRRWRNYLFQGGMAALALLLIMLVVDVVVQAAIVVAIASSVFIVFLVPHSQGSAPRRVIGGNLVAVLVAGLVDVAFILPVLSEVVVGSHIAGDLLAVLSVGLSFLVMVLTNTEHPPAAGTALGLVIGGWSPSAVLIVLLGSLILSVVRALLRRRLINLI